MKNKKMIMIAICFLMSFFTGCNKNDKEDPTTSLVNDVVTSIMIEGTVKAKEESVIFANNSGRVEKVFVQTGDEIKNNKVMIEYTMENEEKTVDTIRCDMDNALVTSVDIVKGQTIVEGSPLITIVDSSSYYILSEVLESFITDIKVDDSVTIISNVDKTKEFKGTIEKIYPMAYINKTGDNVINVEISMENQEELLSLGYTVKVRIE